jgi:hypothetical protein
MVSYCICEIAHEYFHFYEQMNTNFCCKISITNKFHCRKLSGNFLHFKVTSHILLLYLKYAQVKLLYVLQYIYIAVLYKPFKLFLYLYLALFRERRKSMVRQNADSQKRTQAQTIGPRRLLY